ncbi:molybdopterin biosynthesis protein A [Gammaproteobacteria bacterium]|nr:molybdopterin biosynthesis protein A [Gammaproteobacteria bacterium]
MLIDRFGRKIDYLRVSVTDRCDLRCTYCLPKGFKGFEEPRNWLTLDEMYRVLACFSKLGTKHFRFTGGEPLLRKNLASLINKMRNLDHKHDLSMTSNATQLSVHAQQLKESGLDRLNISLDSLRKECVQEITGNDCLEKVLTGLIAAKNAGFTKIKINMVPLIGVNDQDIEPMIAFCIEHDFIMRMIEVMPMGATGKASTGKDLTQLLRKLAPKYKLQESMEILGAGPAKYWKSSDNKFTLGLITPISQHFCETCNRIRLSVDGTLYMCLGQEGAYPLRAMLRAGCSDLELENSIVQAIELKPEKHDFLQEPDKIIRFMSMTGG